MNLVRIAVSLAVMLISLPLRADDMRLGRDVVPTYQVIELRVDPSRSDYSGSTRISLNVTKEVSSFRLHADGIEISRLRLE